MKKSKSPVHPGQVLFEEFLKPLGISQNKIAMDIRVPPRRINEIVLGKRRITPDTALRFAKYFHMSPKFWLTLQMNYDLNFARKNLLRKINKEVNEFTK